MRQNLEPKIWGPHAWFFLESIAMAYPQEPTYDDKKNAEKFFISLQLLIPCKKCRDNYKKHLKEYPLNEDILANRDNLFKWIVDIHNSVDPKKKRTYDEVFNYYLEKYNIGNVKKKKTLCKRNILIILFLILITIYLLYKLYNLM